MSDSDNREISYSSDWLSVGYMEPAIRVELMTY